MMERGMIKWEPFNSVVPASKLINEVLDNKNKIQKPILSEEQIKSIETQVIEYFNLKVDINLDYYENGYIKNINGYIKKVDSISKKVYLDTKILYFNQIINVH